MPGRVALINAPWGRIYCPSMGLGLLKSRLLEAGIDCDVFYLHLDWYARLRDAFDDSIAARLFDLGTEDENLGEWVFAAARFGENDAGLQELANSYVENAPSEARRNIYRDLLSLGPAARRFVDDMVAGLDWRAYDVVGFTTMFSQLNSSLAIAEQVKQAAPDITVMFGGSRCEGEIGEGVIEGHAFVDAVFTGKPDRSVVDFVRGVTRGRPLPADVPGTLTRTAGGGFAAGPPEPLADLADLPLPDYDEYFARCEQVGLKDEYPKFVLVETARGCYWGVKNHCIFCGLLGEKPNYTVRPPRQVIADIDTLTRRYGTDRVMFVDLIMNVKYFREVFEWMANDERPFRFFCELKPDIRHEHLKTLADAGCWRAQPGIESFDDEILDLIDKGTTALDNVLCLRDMRDMAMIPSWNLLYGIPNEDPAAYGKMLDKLRCITHLQPPSSLSRMGLVRNSPALDRASDFGLSNVRPLDAYAHLFKLPPEQTRKIAYSFIADRPDGADPDVYIEPVEAFVTAWKERPERGLLAFRVEPDGGGTIVDTRYNFERTRMRLSPGEAALYGMGAQIREENEITAARETHGLTPAEARDALDRFIERGWIMADNGKCLSLALTAQSPTPWFDVADMYYENALEQSAA